jgi:arsenite/tail-anchored protein-transporting ATPase
MREYKLYSPAEATHRYLFFTGKGGVGKTSVACATAVNLARNGRKVLLVSTDPASNLDDVFQLELHSSPTEIPGVPGLFGANLDPEEAARQYREKVVGPYRGLLPDSAILSIEEQLSGACTVEIAAFDEFTKLLANPEASAGFEHIIFDTAPTGHTLRLLQLPKAWTGFLNDNTHGASCIGPLSGLGDKKDLYSSTVQILSNNKLTKVLLVARPDKAALLEAARASDELRQLGIVNQALIINGVLSTHSEDFYAHALRTRQSRALEGMPSALETVPVCQVPLQPFNLTGIERLSKLFQLPEAHLTKPVSAPPDQPVPNGLYPLVDAFSKDNHGLIMLMGKGGVGKTTVAAAIALGLAERGHKVHLTTTDPAAHLSLALQSDVTIPNLKVSRIDPKAETEMYTRETLERNSSGLDSEGMELLKEDLASPCTEEIAVFRAFARIVAESAQGFVVMDTAPTGHTLLLLDAAESYHREVQRSTGDIPVHVRELLPRLRNPQETHVMIVTLPEATPVYEAKRLQDDLHRAGIHPEWWIVNQSWQGLETDDPVLKERGMAEAPWLQLVTSHANHAAVIGWQPVEPVGAAQITKLVHA